jgi:hypothetical protein
MIIIVACIAYRCHLAWSFQIPCEDVIVSWLDSTFAA